MTQEAPSILQNKQAVPSLPYSALPDPVLSLSPAMMDLTAVPGQGLVLDW